MTIQAFARLCGCKPQTLRYYDHVGLLKPVKVDPWSGYRFYEEDQALAYVKIKSLQKAGFTIEEIKGLLDGDRAAILRAFDEKLAEAETRLAEIQAIRGSFQAEMDNIQEKIEQVRKTVLEDMARYDPAEEFGIGPAQYADILQGVDLAFSSLAAQPPKEIGYEAFSEGEPPEEEAEYLDLLHNPDYVLVDERHGWAHVKEFFDRLEPLEDGAEYALVFRVTPEKTAVNTAFGNTVLGMLLAKNPDKRRSLSCTLEEAEDGENHFWLLRRR